MCSLPASVACGGKAAADARPYCARSCVVSVVTAMHVAGSGRR